MELLKVTLAANLVLCYFSGFSCSSKLETATPNAVVNSSCHFHSVKDCQIQCTNTSQDRIVEDVQNLQSKEPHCFDYRLKIDGIFFAKKNLFVHWFRGSGNVLEMTINDFTITGIGVHAFNSLIFVKLKTLKLHGFRVNHLHGRVFDGLVALQVLELSSFDLLTIGSGILEPCVELHVLEIKNSSRVKISVDNMTGACPTPFQKLEIVKFRDNNLADTITEKSFACLVQVRILDLSQNKITSIGPKTFEAIAKTLNMLNLRNNHLKELTGEIFKNIFSQADLMLLQISLEGNLWHCDCDLQSMQDYLRQYPTTFTGFARCNTPMRWRNHLIQHANLSSNNESLSTTTTAINVTEPPTSEVTSATPPKEQLVTLKCMKYFIQNFRTFVSVGMQKQDKVIQLRKTFDKKHTVTIKDFPTDYTVLWYEKAADDKHGVNHNSVNCFLNRNRSLTRNIKLGDSWRKNKVHTFCMKPKHTLTMTPLNCISFDTSERPDYSAKMWVPKSYRFVAIVLMIVACLLCVLFGIGIVFFLARKYPTLFDSCSRKKPTKCSNDNDDELISRKSSRQSRCNERMYTAQNCFTDSIGPRESQFDYIVWQIDQKQISSISCALTGNCTPPPLPPPHPIQLKRRSQIPKEQNANDIYCELK